MNNRTPHTAGSLSSLRNCAATGEGVASHKPPRHFYDAAEALTNATVGLVVSWLATLFVLGFAPLQSAAITGMFFCLSFSRAWIIRRIFRGLA